MDNPPACWSCLPEVASRGASFVRLTIGVLAAMAAWSLPGGIARGTEPYSPRERPMLEEPWRWHRIPELDGARISAMAETPTAHIWFGLASGLVIHYDGLNWTTTDPVPESADDPQILDLHCSRDGRVYALSSERIDVWNGAWEPLWKNDSGVPLGLYRVAEFPDGRLLVQCAHGLLVMDGEKMEHRTFFTSSRFIRDHGDRFRGGLEMKILPPAESPDGFPQLRQLAMDPQGGIAIAMVPNLLAFLPAAGDLGAADDWKTFPKPEGGWAGQITLHAGRDGKLWIGELEPGWLTFLDLNDGRWQNFSRPGLHPVGITQGADDKLWVAGLGRLDSWDGVEWSSHDITPKGGAWAIEKTLMAAGDQLWYAMAGGITWRVDVGNRLWKSYQDLHYQAETADGRQWFLAGNGTVVERSGETWQRHSAADGLLDTVGVVICTKNGTVWAAGSHLGVAATAKFDGSRWHQQAHPGLGQLVDYRSLHEGRGGKLYIGATRSPMGAPAVMMLDPRSDPPQWQEIPATAPLVNAIDIAEDARQRLWIGGNFLTVLDLGTMQQIPFPETSQAGFVDAIESDPARDMLWVATRGRGIDAYHGSTRKNISITDGLASNAIADIAADGEGGLWIAAAGGISHLRQDGIVTHGLGKAIPGVPIEKGTLRVGSAGALWINRASRYSFSVEAPPSTAQGQAFSPKGESETFCLVRSRDLNPPQVIIDSSGIDVSEKGTSRVSWSGVDAWHETAADELQYSWRSGGGRWSDFSADTQVFLDGLKPGNHLFEVRCRDLDGNLSASTASTVLAIPYPAWRRPWFLATVGLLLAVIVWFAGLMLRQRERHIMAESRMKLDFYTRISHELSTPLTVIISTLENWQSDSSLARFRSPLERALRNAWRLQRMFDDIMALRKAEEGRLVLNFTEEEVGGIVARAVESLRPSAVQGEVDLHYENSVPGLRMRLDEEQLRRVVVNLVSNAIKFTPAQGAVWVRLRQDQAARALVIEVEDNGAGISPDDLPHVFEQYYRSGGSFAARTKGTGVGMAVVKEIIDHWEGKIDVQSPLQDANGTHAGTLIRVKLPLS